MKYISGLLVFLLLACQPTQESARQEVQILPPPDLYQDLFYDVQSRSDLFPDSKTFVDVIPKRDVEEILAAYDELENKEDKKVLIIFLEENFKIPGNLAGLEVAESATASEHIRKLWGLLERPADPYASGTLIPLKNPYVVPGGRFREVYYWDSYFTMLGLQVDGKIELIDNVLENFSFLLDSIGFIPNGNRTYYLGRSQPPFYAQMVDLHVSENGTRTYDYYLPFLLKEYEFWMSGAAELSAENATNRRAVMLEGGVLNRYYDDKST
ncbi:MAG: trehalase family glycosidase, partial [Cyclobacteriaceae bacterium]